MTARFRVYDVDRFFGFLGYGRGNQTYACDGLVTLAGYFRGDAAEIAQLLAPTPFEPIDDRFCVSVADFTRNSGATYIDAAVIVPVRYGDLVGATYYFEYEDRHGSVAGGRELWGYPKRYAKIGYELREDGGRAWVSNEGEPVFELDLTYSDRPLDAAPWRDLSLFPHLQVRAVPQINGPSFQHFDILSRDTSKDYVLHEARPVAGRVSFGPQIGVGGRPLTIVEELGGQVTVGDYRSTAENGVPQVVASLI